MTTERFNQLLDELEGTSLETLKKKNAKYAGSSGDSLRNFRVGARIDGSTMAQTCVHYWKKHLSALLDMVETNNFSDRADVLEKIQDSINYLRFIWCIANDTEDTDVRLCSNCGKCDDILDHEDCKTCHSDVPGLSTPLNWVPRNHTN